MITKKYGYTNSLPATILGHIDFPTVPVPIPAEIKEQNQRVQIDHFLISLILWNVEWSDHAKNIWIKSIVASGTLECFLITLK